MSDIHIHVHTGQEQSQDRPEDRARRGVEERMRKCYDWQTLHELMSDFNKVGLTIIETSERRYVLCRVVNGEPITEDIIDDYVFVGVRDNLQEEISPRHMDIIVDFVTNNISGPVVWKKTEHYNRGPKLYGAPIQINDEKHHAETEHVEFISKDLEDLGFYSYGQQ